MEKQLHVSDAVRNQNKSWTRDTHLTFLQAAGRCSVFKWPLPGRRGRQVNFTTAPASKVQARPLSFALLGSAVETTPPLRCFSYEGGKRSLR